VRCSWSIALCAAAGLSASFGCGTKAQTRLEGKWQGVRTEGVASETRGKADEFARKLSLEFKGDTFSVSTPNGTSTSKYAVKQAEGDTITITTEKDGPTDPQMISLTDTTTLRWAPLAGKTVVFVRKDTK
jgi:hypothetical protein